MTNARKTGFFDGGMKPSPMVENRNVGLQLNVLHPFGIGNLTDDGEQFSTPATSGTAESTYATVTLGTAEIGFSAGIHELEFGLTSAIRSESTAPSTVSWLWQARNVNSTVIDEASFQDLMSADSTATEGTAYVENTYSGRATLNANLCKLPFEIQLKVMSSAVSDGVAKAKNSSYIKVLSDNLYNRTRD